MAMQKLNVTVRTCLNPACSALPTVQLDSQKRRRDGGVIFTAAQALVCKDDIPFGRDALENLNPGFYIAEIPNPGWLFREQQKLLKESESHPAIEEDGQRTVLEGDALTAYIAKSLGTNRNTRR